MKSLYRGSRHNALLCRAATEAAGNGPLSRGVGTRNELGFLLGMAVVKNVVSSHCRRSTTNTAGISYDDA